jgi:hypothetical protein
MNLWRGFAVDPAAGDWSKFRAHIFNGICDYDKAAFEYVLNWLARLVQRPGEHGQTALVLQGDEGTGKGIFGRAIVALCGQHGIHLTQTRHLVGNFNQHLRNKVAAFADEALFAGDPSIRGPLFALITEDTVQFEAKGVDSETGANCLHIVMATNEDWAIPAGVNARRFCVLRVSSAHRQDTAHFGAIEAELRAGGLAAMLHDLQARDISNFNVFALPATAALGDQKIRSLRGPERWLLDCLQRGRLGFDPWGADPLKVSKTGAYDAYRSAARENREHSPKDIATWAKSVKGALGECWRETKLWAGGMRSRQLVFAALPDSRAAFERYIKQKIEWETDIDHGGEHAIA